MAKGEKTIIILACTVCHERNYTFSRKRKAGGQQHKLELKKYCPRCRKHTLHKQVK